MYKLAIICALEILNREREREKDSNCMKSIIRIINLNFWKSITGPFFAFVFPVIFLSILGFLLGYHQLLGSIFAIPAVTIGLTVLPTALFEFRTSSLLKRIGVTPIKPWTFIATIALYYVVIMFISTITTICFALIMFSNFWSVGKEIANVQIPSPDGGVNGYKAYAPTLENTLANVDWFGLIWGVLMNILVSTSMGILLSNVCKSSISIQGIGIPILILSEFLAAQVLPLTMVKEIKALYYVSYLTPFKYSTGLIINSWNGFLEPLTNNNIVDGILNISYSGTSNIFDINQPFNMINSKGVLPENLIVKNLFESYDKVLNLIMPIVFTGLFGAIISRTFKWSNR